MRNEVVLSQLDVQDFPQVIELVQRHVAAIPPFVTPSAHEIESIIRDPMHYLRLRYAEHMPASYQTPCFVASVNDTVVTAMQLFVPEGRTDCSVLWFVGCEDVPFATLRLLDEVFTWLRRNGWQKVYSDRNPFGPGWSGIADCWPHLLLSLLQMGMRARSDPWVLYWQREGTMKEINIPGGFSLTTKRHSNNLNLDIQLCSGNQRVAEAQIWFPAPECLSFVRARVAELEWMEVNEDHRRQGFGSAMLTAAFREVRNHGIEVLLLWTKLDNVGMRRVAERCGFVVGPVLHWFEIEL